MLPDENDLDSLFMFLEGFLAEEIFIKIWTFLRINVVDDVVAFYQGNWMDG